MRAWRQYALAAALSVIAACHVGPQVDKTDLGVKPQGANAVVALTGKARTKKVEYEGELLDVRGAGVLMLIQGTTELDPRIVLIPWDRINRAATTDKPVIVVRPTHGEKQRRTATDNLRNVSRFPQGLSAELTNRLLARYGQSALDTIE